MIRFAMPALMMALLLLPYTPLQAHISSEGIIDTYSGLLHPFTEPAHLVTIIVLGLILTQQGKTVPPYGWASFCMAAFAGLLTSLMPVTMTVAPALLLLSAILGALVAGKLSLHIYLCIFFSSICGFILGYDSTPGPAAIGILIVTIIGTTAGIGIALLVVIVVGESCKKYWQQIAIRVVGSWITASAILVFALGLKSAG